MGFNGILGFATMYLYRAHYVDEDDQNHKHGTNCSFRKRQGKVNGISIVGFYVIVRDPNYLHHLDIHVPSYVSDELVYAPPLRYL